MSGVGIWQRLRFVISNRLISFFACIGFVLMRFGILLSIVILFRSVVIRLSVPALIFRVVQVCGLGIFTFIHASCEFFGTIITCRFSFSLFIIVNGMVIIRVPFMG